jgi:hypothetical protein
MKSCVAVSPRWRQENILRQGNSPMPMIRSLKLIGFAFWPLTHNPTNTGTSCSAR